MENYCGGGIPFSAVLNEKRSRKKTSRRSKTRKHKKTERRNKKRITRKNSKKCPKHCKCGNNMKGPSPEGLGYCACCQPLNIIMRGKDDKLWKIEEKNGKNLWLKV